MKLPSMEQIKALHRKYAIDDEAFELIYTHCQIVRDIAFELIKEKKLDVDVQLVEVGCMLHDIGVYKLYDSKGVIDDSRYIQHGVLGYELLKEEGFEEVICRFASHHTGVGLTKQDIQSQKLPLPEQDMLADTKEELIVMFADKFHSKDEPPCFNTAEWYEEHVARFGDDKRELFKDMIAELGLPDIESLSKSYSHIIRS